MSLEQSIARMIGRYAKMADQVEAAKAEIAALRAEASPGLQSPTGLMYNQLGADTDKDGKPDGWMIHTDPSITTWTLAGVLPQGTRTEVVKAGSLADEFYNSIPGNPGYPHYCATPLHFWRVTWDVARSQKPPSVLRLLDMAKVPTYGTAAAWIKLESGDLSDKTTYPTWGRWITGKKGWTIFADPLNQFAHTAGNYRHMKLSINLTKAPKGSVLIAGPQAITARIDPAKIGWNVYPGLNRVGTYYTIERDTRRWK